MVNLGPEPPVDESQIRPNANLSGINLPLAILTDADLSEAYLSGAHLRKADVSTAHLLETEVIDCHNDEVYATKRILHDLGAVIHPQD